MNPIEQLLRREIGLDAASVGSTAIERTVRLRMKILGLNDPEEYLSVLESSRSRSAARGRSKVPGQTATDTNEWEELLESVIVAETWFFRDREPFAALVELVLREWLPQHPTETMRLLSLPCSSGEEPYSMAMALLDADISPDRFTIDAADISTRALARARRAVYGKNSFRGKDLAYRNRHFDVTPEGHALQARVRQSVQFHQANILADAFFSGKGPYDFIFCRNLLIYFDRNTQAQALAKLSRLLSPPGSGKGGVLFLGPAELPLATGQGFVSANFPMAFACRLAGSDNTKTERRRPKVLAQSVIRPAKREPSQENLSSKVRLPDLIMVRQLADAGRLSEAVELCQAHLARQGPSAQAFYLLGLVRDAIENRSPNEKPGVAYSPGRTEFNVEFSSLSAEDYYRKALYLEPTHYETLLQMSLLLEKNGDPASRDAARTFKRRALRAQSRNTVKRDITGLDINSAFYTTDRVQPES